MVKSQLLIYLKKGILTGLFLSFFLSNYASGACGGTSRTWAGTTTNWNTAANWSGVDVPDTSAEDAIIVNTGFNAWVNVNTTVGCVDIQSGILEGTSSRKLTVTGDYFKALNANSLNLTSNNFVISMGGTAAQTFEAVDDIRDLEINNTTTVNIKNSFRIMSDFTISSTGTTYIEGDVTLNNTNIQQIIPAGHTLVIKSGASLFARGGLTVGGVLIIEGGGELKLYRNELLDIQSGGVLQLNGSSGNPARVVSEASGRSFAFTMAGTLSANYFVIQRTNTLGLNVSGTISQLDNGEFRGIADTGYALTLQSTASMPSTLTALGFYNDDAVTTPQNFDASGYNNGVFALDDYAGDVSGSAFENDTNSQITWNVPAATKLAITNDTETGEPQAFFDPADIFTFAEFAFTLTQADTATDITQVDITMTGTASMSDIAWVRAYRDDNNNCNYNATDSQVGTDLVFSGSPPKATITLSAGNVTTNGPSNMACLSIRAAAATNASDQKTVKFAVASTSDVTNSQGYTFSATSGPPLESGTTVIRNPNYSSWNGTTDTLWSDSTNWTGGLPSSTRDCQVGTGINITQVDANPISCANASLLSSGTMDWNSTAFSLDVYATLEIQSSYNFNNATSGVITMAGANSQSMSIATNFPGSMIINNSGVSGNNVVSVTADSSLSGNLTCTQGKLHISGGITLTVLGDITIQTGCEIEIGAQGTLALGNGSTLTVDSGGVLTVVGDSSNSAKITTTSTAQAMHIIVNGTIAAKYYIFEHLDTAGVSIEAGATIDATNYLQHGSFLYPVNSNSTFLTLKRQIPGDALNDLIFSSNGSAATNILNIDTTAAGAGTLSITGYSGDWAGVTYDVDPVYNISWSGATNTIQITQEATSPTPVTVGNTYTMGRIGFTQTLAGASYADTDITSLKITLTGTGTASDISNVSLYADSDCDSAAGTLIGTGTFSGSPASLTFALGAGDLTIAADLVAPPKNCVYVQYSIATGATGGNTVGFKINSAGDFVNSLSYAISASTPPPITSGTASTISAPTTTIWTGTTSTVWTDDTNWSAGAPTSTKTCQIPDVANDPIITSGTATCQNIDITNGILTVNTGATLQTYGNFSNSGTFTSSGTLEIIDGGSAIDQNITTSGSLTIPTLDISRTGGGTIYINSTALTVNTININNTAFTLRIANGKKLILPNGLSLSGGSMQIDGGAILEIGSAQTLLVNGGTFIVNGTNDSFPQTSTNKGKIMPQGGSGTWAFSATSGTLNLVGFYFDMLDTNGLDISGSTILSNLDGGQFTNLSSSYASVKAIQLNSSGSIPISATNVAFNWGNFNSFNPANGNTPDSSQGYTLVSSSGCASQTIDFTGWTGDWFESQATFDVTSKISASGCTINLGAASSSVSLLSFTAQGYNDAVDVLWSTYTENNHIGFNVYRSNADATEFQQINSAIIRNINNTGAAKGSYRFKDLDVNNDQTYYYYIEDVAINGAKILHGPVSATPKLANGALPADDPTDNNNANPNDGDDGGSSGPSTITNPSYKDLGNGVVILAQTSTSLKIQIVPDAPVFSASLWNGAYDEVSITGYSKQTEAGLPELPERDLLIEVNSYATTANLINSTITESVINGHLIAPAPSYALDGGGILQPSYAVTDPIYAANVFSPASYFDLNTTLITSNGKKYLKIKILPLTHNTQTPQLKLADKIILEIGLDGNDWEIVPPTGGSAITPYEIANNLQIDFTQEGFYQLNFDDLTDSFVDGPFNAVDVNKLRLYLNDQEIPMEVHSPSGNFTSGDYLRFYLPFEASLEDLKNTAVLTTVTLLSSAASSERIAIIDASESQGSMADESQSLINKSYEQNNIYVDGESLGDNLDHYFWAGLLNFAGLDSLSTVVAMNELATDSMDNVRVTYSIKSQIGYFGNHSLHHVRLTVNGTYEFDQIFDQDKRMPLVFEIPANQMIAGNNTLLFTVLGTYAVAGDFDRVYVDKIDLSYVGKQITSSGIIKFKTLESGQNHVLSGFTSNDLHFYDTSLGVSKLSNVNIQTFDAGATYQASFYLNDNTDSDGYKNIYAVQNGKFMSPSGLSLVLGRIKSLKDTNNRADLIIIGHASLLEAAKDLVTQRESQNMEVMTVSANEIYNVFSYAQKKSNGIRDFLSFAKNNWALPPRYVLFLGDGTLDPLDHNVNGEVDGERSATNSQTLPVPVVAGRFMEFGSDNYFASTAESAIPNLALGRLPSNNPDDIRNYISKVIAYENQSATPLLNKKVVFFSDEDTGGYEQFFSKSVSVSQNLGQFSTEVFDRTTIGSLAATKAEIINQFNSAPLILSFLGHGASDRWGNGIFLNSDVDALSNSTYPMVFVWNCESAQYYLPWNQEISLGEHMIFNKSGGAIIFVGATTQTTPSAQFKLSNNIFAHLNDQVQSPYNDQRVGDLLKNGIIATGEDNYHRDIINSMTLLGDPSLKIPDTIYTPYIAPIAPAEAAPIKKSSGGCSAIGSENGNNQGSPWEWPFYFVSIILALRWRFLKLTKDSK